VRKRFVVIDDFYKDPRAMRSAALGLEYSAQSGHTYPGRNSSTPILDSQITDAVSQAVGTPLEPNSTQLCGHFRTSTASDTFEQDVHVDPEPDNLWAGVLYLNTPKQCEGRPGTITWRHKRLGIESVPMSREEGRALGFSSYEDVRRELIYGDGLDRSKWDMVNYAAMRFNRLVLFRPTDWHSHGENFGSTLEDCRLVQIFFWRRKSG